MAKPSTKVWDLEKHTEAKHAILKRYLQAWFPILSSFNDRILYIDGFAGPGEYSKGEPGSPIIALDTAIAAAGDNKLKPKAEILFLFIEENKSRCEHLESLLAGRTLPHNIKYSVECGKFNETLTSALDQIDKQKQSLAPTFAFIDPFGISDTPFAIIERIMKFKRCEVMITFMSGFINRFKEHPKDIDHIDALLGTKNWRHELLEDKEKKGEEEIVEFYQERLKSVAKYVRSFEMKNGLNQTIYRLIFGTNSILGLRKMKESMWKVDGQGTFTFSDRTDPFQTVLFELKPDYNDLKKLLINQFRGRTVTIEEINAFIVTETAYLDSKIKTEILKPMEYANPPEIRIEGKRRKGTFPDGTIITFI
ncbi:three-Cys-motif partner protein TcmP [Methanosarcina mazei]|uniref:Three-Cys-motif partner protein TcmP n=1 Tax=Methanosarcina mazei TaxID=2209 RepID=A0A6C0VHV1_METMZ|nr:three-Cys-motif partner protein TcmP [Methanosarcina mazei]QIB91010.1 three-Cys-motif partner protein TcmP [Methanosarcina mazei]